jgi:hypothetical protein
MQSSILTTSSSYLVIALLEEKLYLPLGSKNTAWEAVHYCWYKTRVAGGESKLVSKRIEVVYGKEYEEVEEDEEDEEDEDDDDDDDDNEDDGSATPPGMYRASNGIPYPIPNGAYLASDGRLYPQTGYYLASDHRYYPSR